MEELLARSDLSKLKPLPRLEELYPLVEDELKQMNLNNMESNTQDHDPQFMGSTLDSLFLGGCFIGSVIVVVLEMCCII